MNTELIKKLTGVESFSVRHLPESLRSSIAKGKRIILVTFDIEKTGRMNLGHPINSIGWCVGDLFGRVLQKSKINLKVRWPTIVSEDTKTMDYGDFEPRCWDEFWSKRPPALIEELKKDAHEQEFGMTKFATWLDVLEKEYPEATHKIVFLSDNASFDIAALDVNLERYTKRGPIRYSLSGKFRSLYPPDDMLAIVPDDVLEPLIKKRIDAVVEHDHDPSNDAEHIYRQFILAMEVRRYIFNRVDFAGLLGSDTDTDTTTDTTGGNGGDDVQKTTQ
jgi:hypothetical protein